MYQNSRRGPFKSRFHAGGKNRSRFKASRIDASMYVKKANHKVKENEVASSIKFSEMPFDTVIHQSIEKKGYINPTPIQEKTIPHILERRDVIGIANTGTGKTGAFILPLLQQILNNPEVRVLILVPTRELGVQIQDEIYQFSQGMRIYSTLVIGGRYMQRQIQDLRRDPHFIIATPGRLKDLVNQKVINLTKISTVILDEADRMVDMGFIQDITMILSLLPKERQSLCFSATMSRQIESIVNKFLKTPITVSVKVQNVSEQIDQDIVRVNPGQTKIEVLEKLLKNESFSKVLIFSRTKWGADKLTHYLNGRGFKSAAIHGDKRQRQREQAVALFRNQKCNILVATDVAARGIDIPDITHVINFDEPATYDDYVHRIGRTGRGDKKGTALTFLS